MRLKRPDLILFDYGDTLAWEPVPDFLRGWQAVFQSVTENPDGATPEDAKRIGDELWQRFSGSRSLSASRKGGWEIHEWQQLRTVLEALGLKTSLPLAETEIILMENACPSTLKPYAMEMMNFLREHEIRTGVISNIGWSGNALAHRLKLLFPFHSFEFAIASSEYGIRKPDPLLFRIALKKARLPAEKVWYCGDNWQADVLGAHAAGIFPVWYNESGGKPPGGADFPCLSVKNWQEFTHILSEIQK